MMDGRVPTSGIIVIPHAKRFPYGDDVAAARSAGQAWASLRGRVGHLIERSSGYRAARVSRCEAIRTSSGTATAVTRAGDRPASEGRTRAATQMKAAGRCRSTLNEPVFCLKPTEPPLVLRVNGSAANHGLNQTRSSPKKPGRFSSSFAVAALHRSQAGKQNPSGHTRSLNNERAGT